MAEEILASKTVETPEIEDQKLDSKIEDISDKKEVVDDEVEELGLEDEKETKVEEELPEPSRPSFKDIKEKYPNIFKEFPELREVYFRDQKYTEIYPTVDDAQEAFEKSQAYEDLETAFYDGNVDGLLGALKDGNSPSYKVLSQNFLPTLMKQDRDLYLEATTPVIDQFLKSLYQAGVNSGNENIKRSAEWAAKWAFDDEKYASGEKRVSFHEKKDDPERKKLEDEKTQFLIQKYEDTRESLITSANNRLAKEAAKYVGEGFNDFIKNKLIEETIEQVNKTLVADTQYMKQMESLWKKAANSNFSSESKSRIYSAFLARALNKLPAVSRKIRSDALGKGNGNQVDNNESTQGKQLPLSGGVSSGHHKTNDPKKIDWGKTSDEDYLAGRITYKK